MKKSELRNIIKESIREILKEDIRELLADQLTNVADEGGFKDGKDFAKKLEKIGGASLNPKVSEKIYNEFMDLDPKSRMKLGMSNSAMYRFLAKFGIK